MESARRSQERPAELTSALSSKSLGNDAKKFKFDKKAHTSKKIGPGSASLGSSTSIADLNENIEDKSDKILQDGVVLNHYIMYHSFFDSRWDRTSKLVDKEKSFQGAIVYNKISEVNMSRQFLKHHEVQDMWANNTIEMDNIHWYHCGTKSCFYHLLSVRDVDENIIAILLSIQQKTYIQSLPNGDCIVVISLLEIDSVSEDMFSLILYTYTSKNIVITYERKQHVSFANDEENPAPNDALGTMFEGIKSATDTILGSLGSGDGGTSQMNSINVSQIVPAPIIKVNNEEKVTDNNNNSTNNNNNNNNNKLPKKRRKSVVNNKVDMQHLLSTVESSDKKNVKEDITQCIYLDEVEGRTENEVCEDLIEESSVYKMICKKMEHVGTRKNILDHMNSMEGTNQNIFIYEIFRCMLQLYLSVYNFYFQKFSELFNEIIVIDINQLYNMNNSNNPKNIIRTRNKKIDSRKIQENINNYLNSIEFIIAGSKLMFNLIERCSQHIDDTIHDELSHILPSTYLNDIQRDFSYTLLTTNNLGECLKDLFDKVSAYETSRNDKIGSLLSLAALFSLPIGFVATICGMNFGDIYFAAAMSNDLYFIYATIFCLFVCYLLIYLKSWFDVMQDRSVAGHMQKQRLRINKEYLHNTNKKPFDNNNKHTIRMKHKKTIYLHNIC
jgi:hypothetical protein